MLSKANLQQSIREIYGKFLKRHVTRVFTLESIQEIFEIGNEVFQKNNPEELEKIRKRPPSNAPDILDDEPFTLERTLEIFQELEKKFTEVSPELIRRVFELNSKLAWKAYRRRYDDYIINVYSENYEDDYLAFLAAIVFYDHKRYDEALHCVNRLIPLHPSSANLTHIKGLCMMQLGELDVARTYLYQALFLVELMEDIPFKKKTNSLIYPNYPIEFHTSAELIRTDLQKIDQADKIYRGEMLPLVQ